MKYNQIVSKRSHNLNILGISAFYHDSAAALVRDGEIIAAAQEERFSRKRHDDSFPKESIRFCLEEGGINIHDIDFVVFYEKPLVKFERLLKTYLTEAPRGLKSFLVSMPLWLKEKLYLKEILLQNLTNLTLIDSDMEKSLLKKRLKNKILFTEHHISHMASAFYPSPFAEAAILSVDGVGEWSTTSLAVGRGNSIEILKEIHFPHSLGLLYSAFTYYTGFKVNSGEYKLMGLAPYGDPKYVDLIKNTLIDIKEDGSFRLNLDYFDYLVGFSMTNDKFNAVFGGDPRKSESLITQREMDIAASIQMVTEEVMIKLSQHARDVTGMRNLCMSGGVALNCVANGKIVDKKIFDRIWIQPAAGDAGSALGAAMHVSYTHPGCQILRKVQEPDAMKGAYLGSSFSNEEIRLALEAEGAVFHTEEPSKLIRTVALSLSEGMVVGWHQGRMEFGPRALGARSILADPRNTEMQSIVNLKIKHRESFRPFAPSVLSERTSEWFSLAQESPYMLLVGQVLYNKQLRYEDEKALFGIEKLKVQRSLIPAVTHVDCSARIQTVSQETNPRYHALINEFEAVTGCPILVNTSFNVRGEPIVCSPVDSYRCFMSTEIDVLAIGDFILYKDEQPPQIREKYKDLKDFYEGD